MHTVLLPIRRHIRGVVLYFALLFKSKLDLKVIRGFFLQYACEPVIHTNSSVRSVIVLSHSFRRKLRTLSSISPHPDLLNWPRKSKSPRNFWNHSFFSSEIAFQFTCRLRRPFRRRTCCLSLDFAFWSEGPLTKERKKRLKKRERQEKRSLSNALHRTMNFPHHSNVSAECLSDSLQQILKCDNGPQKWVMVSFCWFHFPDPPYPPGLCTSIN